MPSTPNCTRLAALAVSCVLTALLALACGEADTGADDASDAEPGLDLRGNDASQDTEPETREPDTAEPDTSEPDTADTTDATDAPDDAIATCGPGAIIGRVCSPSGDEWIGGALVTVSGVDCDDQPFALESVARGDGTFAFDDVPSGLHQLSIVKGSFEASYPMRVRPGETTDVTSGTEKTCLVDDSVRIAVIAGYYDSVHQIVDGLGLGFDYYSDFGSPSPAETLLRDPQALAGYDIIMINCGLQYDDFGQSDPDGQDVVRQAMQDHLAGFVDAGGSLYVSDWAWWFLGASGLGFVHSGDDPYRGAWLGSPGDVDATIVDPLLQDALQTSSLTIHFPLQGWALAEPTLPDGASALVEGDVALIDGSTVSAAPLLVELRRAPSAGRIFFTSFHNEDQLAADIERILQQVIFSL